MEQIARLTGISKATVFRTVKKSVDESGGNRDFFCVNRNQWYIMTPM